MQLPQIPVFQKARDATSIEPTTTTTTTRNVVEKTRIQLPALVRNYRLTKKPKLINEIECTSL